MKMITIIIMILIMATIVIGGTLDSKSPETQKMFPALKENLLDEATFTINNTLATTTKENFAIEFYEECGTVNNYTLKKEVSCIIKEPEYKTSEVYEPKNDTWHNETTITGYKDKNSTCYEPINQIDYGTGNYKIQASITPATCKDGQIGWRIDWKPMITIAGTTYKREDWAWWNATLMDKCIRWYNIRNTTTDMTTGSVVIDKMSKANMTLTAGWSGCTADYCSFGTNGRSSGIDTGKIVNQTAIVWAVLNRTDDAYVLSSTDTNYIMYSAYGGSDKLNSYQGGDPGAKSNATGYTHGQLAMYTVETAANTVDYFLNGSNTTSTTESTMGGSGGIATDHIGRDSPNGVSSGQYYILAIWNRSLTASEISYLYSLGKDFSPYEAETTAPIVQLITPVNWTAYMNATNVTFTCNATDNVKVESISLIINGSLNQTTATPGNGTPTNWNIDFPQTNSTYEWTCNATDNSTNTNTTSAYHINMTYEDHSPPDMMQTYKFYQYPTTTVSIKLNWTNIHECNARFEGYITYNYTAHKIIYCDATNWVQI